MAKKITRPFNPKPIIVDWVDSMGTSGWHAETEGKATDMRCCTVGHFVEEDKDSITVALSRSPYSHGDYLTIPRCAIRRTRRLKE